MQTLLFAALFVLFAIANCCAHRDPDRICSVKNPTSSQVCISVKFPWKENPVFFCTDYTKINYNPECIDPNESHHCPDDGRNDTLKIATPWDCCPIISTPNRCSNVECPPQPFNRTCKEIKTLGACCPGYFCDAGVADNCKTHRLKHSCMNPPKNKLQCIGFRDPFGCCNKYQCKGEGKPGYCPALTRRNQRMIKPTDDRGFVRTTVDNIVTGAKQRVNKAAKAVKSTLEKHGGTVGRKIAPYIPIPFESSMPKKVVALRCTGDHTCPGTMKCCALSVLARSYSQHTVLHENINGVKKTTSHVMKANYYKPQKRNNLLDGICVEPDPEGIESSTQDLPSHTGNDYISSTSTPPATETFSTSSSTQRASQDLSTPPNPVTETISQTNPTITVTSESSSTFSTSTPKIAGSLPPLPTLRQTTNAPRTPPIPKASTLAPTNAPAAPTNTPVAPTNTPAAPSTSTASSSSIRQTSARPHPTQHPTYPSAKPYRSTTPAAPSLSPSPPNNPSKPVSPVIPDPTIHESDDNIIVQE